MSTKQRGDVEKITPKDKYRIHNFPGSHYEFDRDEFRRIWEAGQREFNPISVDLLIEKEREIASLSAKVDSLVDERAVLHNRCTAKDAEIARLKAELGQTWNRIPKVEKDLRDEVARLRGWLNEIDKIVNLRGEVERSVARALAGEKVPQ